MVGKPLKRFDISTTKRERLPMVIWGSTPACSAQGEEVVPDRKVNHSLLTQAQSWALDSWRRDCSLEERSAWQSAFGHVPLPYGQRRIRFLVGILTTG